MAAFPKCKLIFLGERNVGKTALISQFMYDEFSPATQSTVGVDFFSRIMYLDDRTVRLQLWDTAGQERFQSLIPSYVRDTAAAVIVYDVSDRRSFELVSKWATMVRLERGSEASITLVGNKSDLRTSENNMTDELFVSREEGRQQAEKLGATFIETSAKLGYNIRQLFRQVAATLPTKPTGQPEKEPEFFPEPIRTVIIPTVDEETPKWNCKC